MYPKLGKRIFYSILVAFACEVVGRTQRVKTVVRNNLGSLIRSRV